MTIYNKFILNSRPTFPVSDQVTNILETSPPVVYALQRKVGQYLKAKRHVAVGFLGLAGTYTPRNPETFEGVSLHAWAWLQKETKTHLCKPYIFEVQAFSFNKDKNWSQMSF